MATPPAHRLPIFTRWYLWAFCGVFSLSLAANILLVRKTKQLQSHFEAELNQLNQIVPGERLPPLTGSNIAGGPVSIDLESVGRPSALLVYSPSCHFCKQNWGAWNRLLRSLKARGFLPIFVDLSGATDRPFIRQHGLDDSIVLTNVSAESKLAYALRSTPTTILFDRRGKAQKSWVGSLSAQDLEDIEHRLKSL